MTITFNPKKIVIFLGVIIICLIAANMFGMVSKYYFGSHRIALFDLDKEANVPTLYSSVTILLCAGLLAVIAIARKKQGKRDYLYWAGLAAIFVFLSVDETAALHENIIRPLRTALHTSGVLYFAWVIPYGIFAIVLLLIYLRFLFSLNPRIRYLIIFSGIIYVTGALGGELVGGYWLGLHGQENMTYEVITTFEESLEMIGILVFIYTLMSYITSDLSDLFFHIGLIAQDTYSKTGPEELVTQEGM